MNRVAIYCRVSTTEQANEGFSIEEQEKRLKSFCRINEWKLVDKFIDAGYSGGNTERPALTNLLNNMDKFDLVLVYKLDRLSRSVRDLMALLDKFEENDVAFRSATEVFDTSSAFGKLFITLVGAMAEWERSTISERTMMGKYAAMEKGYFIGNVPFCYDKVDGKLVPNENRKVVDFIIDRFKKGLSFTQISNELNHSKYKTPRNRLWTKTRVIDILTGPTIRGHSAYGDKLFKNTHEPIVSEKDYRTVRNYLDSLPNRRRHTYSNIFRSKLVCPHGCGGRLSLNTNRLYISKTDSYRLHQYYRCNQCKKIGQKSPSAILMTEAEKSFIKHLKNFDFSNYEVREPETKENVIDIDKIMRQREKYQKAWSMDLVSDDEFKKRMEETQELIDEYNKDTLEEQNARLTVEQIKSINNLLIKSWDNLTVQEKEEFVTQTIDKIEFEVVHGHGYSRSRTPNSMRITNIDYLI